MLKLLIWVICTIIAVSISGLFIDNAAIGFLNGIAWGLVAVFLCEIIE